MHLDIVGCGEVLRQYHAPVLRRLVRNGLLSIQGCYDVDETRARLAASNLGANTYGAIPQAGATDLAEAALIATPPESHAPLAATYVKRGGVALIEKPFTARLDEAVGLVKLAAAHGASILIGHLRRFYPSVQLARDFVLAGGLGEIRAAEAHEGGRWEWPARSDYFLHSRYGGVVYDTGSHVIDTILFVLGMDHLREDAEFEVEWASRSAAEPSHHLEARLRVCNVAVTLVVSRQEPLANVIKLYGDRGMLLLPTSFDTTITLIQGHSQFSLQAPPGTRRASDVLSCFQAEHMEVLAKARKKEGSSILAAERFLLLTRILEGLGDAT